MDKVVRERVVVVGVLASLVLGIALYNLIPLSSDEGDPVRPAVLATTTTAAPTGHGDAAAPALTSGSAFGSGIAALDAGATASDLTISGEGVDPVVPRTPIPPPEPAPTCPTDVGNDAYEQVAGPVGAALGQPLPADDLRVLAEIAAGCSAEPATTPLIGLALDIGRLVPATGVPPADLSAVPAVDAPTLPQPLIDALAPLAAPIQDACANVGLLGVLLAVIPGAAGVPVHGQDLADAIVTAQTLCAQFE